MRHIKEFSRFAHVYADYNRIQKQVAKELLGLVEGEPKRMVDLGCGSGTLYKELSWELESFIACDLSATMLENHPTNTQVELLCQSFDDTKLFERLKGRPLDYIISSSSLQWSRDLKALFHEINDLGKPFALTLFTSNTFKTLHEKAKTTSPLHSKEFIEEVVKETFKSDVIFKEYTLSFKSTKELFTYLKRSGVSGNEKQLNYKQTKSLMQDYPLDYLEFEVAFIVKNSA